MDTIIIPKRVMVCILTNENLSFFKKASEKYEHSFARVGEYNVELYIGEQWLAVDFQFNKERGKCKDQEQFRSCIKELYEKIVLQ